jgi:hypothetical protein
MKRAIKVLAFIFLQALAFCDDHEVSYGVLKISKGNIALVIPENLDSINIFFYQGDNYCKIEKADNKEFANIKNNECVKILDDLFKNRCHEKVKYYKKTWKVSDWSTTPVDKYEDFVKLIRQDKRKIKKIKY